MKKIVFLLTSIFTASALTGCGSDPESVALGMAKAVAAGDAEKLASYCSPEYKEKCNVEHAKWLIETYQKNFQPVRLNGGWLPRQRRAQNLWSIVGSVGRS